MAGQAASGSESKEGITVTTASGIEKARARAAAAVLGVCAALLICGVAASPAAASSASLQGTFTVYEPKGHVRSNAPCQPETPCGVGSLAEFGSATITILSDNLKKSKGARVSL